MKKSMVAFVLLGILVFALFSSAFAEEEEGSKFEFTLANNMELPVDVWLSDEEPRCMLAILAWYQLADMNAIRSDSYHVTQSLVCGVAEDTLAIVICGEDDTLLVLFIPDKKEARYCFMEKADLTDLQVQLQERFDPIFVNTLEGLQNAYTIFSSVMTGQ